MPIVKHSPISEPTTPKEIPLLTPDSFKDSIYDISTDDLSSLYGFISGSPWTIKAYYRQVLTETGNTMDLDIGLSPTQQQYYKINDLEIRVTQELSFDQNSDDIDNIGISIEGSGNLFPTFIPNNSDVFIAETKASPMTLFKVKNVRRKSISKTSTYSIEYHAIGFLTETNERYVDLENKVIDVFYFNKSLIQTNINPVIREEVLQQQLNLSSSYAKLVIFYGNTFMSERDRTLLVPGQSELVYDKYIVDILYSILESDDLRSFGVFTRHNIEHLNGINQPNIFTALKYRDGQILNGCCQKMELLNLDGVRITPGVVSPSLICTGIRYIVYPVDQDLSIIPQSNVTSSSLYNTARSKETEVYFNEDNQLSFFPNYYPVLFDDFYILSENFYRDLGNKSLMEMCCTDFINKRKINKDILTKLINGYYSLPRLEQFYYGVLLLILIKGALNEPV